MPDVRPVALPDGSVVHSDPEIMGGTPVFVGTRVPVQVLVDHLVGGSTVDEFLDDFPSVRREPANAFMEQATKALLARRGPSAPAPAPPVGVRCLDCGSHGMGRGEERDAASPGRGLFDVFVTGDKSIPHQQNLSHLSLGIILLRTRSTQFRDIQPYLQEIRDAVTSIASGEIVFIPPE